MHCIIHVGLSRLHTLLLWWLCSGRKHPEKLIRLHLKFDSIVPAILTHFILRFPANIKQSCISLSIGISPFFFYIHLQFSRGPSIQVNTAPGTYSITAAHWTEPSAQRQTNTTHVVKVEPGESVSLTLSVQPQFFLFFYDIVCHDILHYCSYIVTFFLE